MTKIILTTFSIIFNCQIFGQLKPKEIFIGIERIKEYEDTRKSNYKWYHLSILTFKDDSVFLDQKPIAIYKKDTIFSNSEGGFYYYKGTIEKYQGKKIANLELDSCYHCPSQFTRFTPPKLVREDGTVSTNYKDTVTRLLELSVFENPKIKYKTMVIEKTNSNRNILVNRTLYRRQKKK